MTESSFSISHRPLPRTAIACQYFLYFGVMGIYLPYFNLYCYHLGFSGFDIGVLSALRSIALVVFPMAWGALADQDQRSSADLYPVQHRQRGDLGAFSDDGSFYAHGGDPFFLRYFLCADHLFSRSHFNGESGTRKTVLWKDPAVGVHQLHYHGDGLRVADRDFLGAGDHHLHLDRVHSAGRYLQPRPARPARRDPLVAARRQGDCCSGSRRYSFSAPS